MQLLWGLRRAGLFRLGQRPRFDIWVVVVTQFGMSLAFNFMAVFLPFYVTHISGLDQRAALIWVGVIMSIASVSAALTSPFWGAMTDRWSPKALFDKGLFSHFALITLMAFTKSLPLLAVFRFLQGLFGGISTIGLVIVSVLAVPADVPRWMGVFQSAITLGQIVGPPLGALAAAYLGFRAAFLLTSLLIGASLALSFFWLSPIPPQPGRGQRAAASRPAVLFAWLVGMAATMQIVFLPSVLPALLGEMQVTGQGALLSAGVVIMASGVTATAGTYLFGRVAAKVSTQRLIVLVGVGGSLTVLLLGLTRDPWSFTLVRMCQAGLISAILPLTFSLFAQQGGGTIGTLNSSRFAGNAIGPLAGTLLLSYGSPLLLYGVLAAFTLTVLLAFWGLAEVS